MDIQGTKPHIESWRRALRCDLPWKTRTTPILLSLPERARNCVINGVRMLALNNKAYLRNEPHVQPLATSVLRYRQWHGYKHSLDHEELVSIKSLRHSFTPSIFSYSCLFSSQPISAGAIWSEDSFSKAANLSRACGLPLLARITPVAYHMHICQARCSRCFYSEMDTSKIPCRCNDGRKKHYSSYDGNTSDISVDRLLCRDCNRIDNPDLQVLREKRDRRTYTNLTRQALTCAKCTEVLPRTGPLWWFCSKCSAECRSHNHPEWGRKLEV
jgi:hypothetical protein